MRLRVGGEVTRGGFRLGVDVDVRLRGVTALVGASGAGKSTFLRLIGGFEPDAAADVEVAGEHWQRAVAPGRAAPAHARAIGMVFQEPRLFPHLDAGANLRFAARAGGRREGSRLSFEEVVEELDLSRLLPLRPHQLSGGQRQRVALGRALLTPAKLRLFDEPLAALDAKSRQEIAPYLQRLCRRHAVPIVYVSHALPEVLAIASQVLVAAGGRIAVVPSIPEFSTSFSNPLLGDEAGAVVACRFRRYDARHHLSEMAFGAASLFVPGDLSQAGPVVLLQIPAREVSLATAPVRHISILNRVEGEIDALREQGPSVLARVRCGGQKLLARITRRSAQELALAPGVRVQALIKSVAVRPADL